MPIPNYLLEPDCLVDADYCPDHGDYESAEHVCPSCLVEAVTQQTAWGLIYKEGHDDGNE